MIELLIVMTLIIILAGISMTQYRNVQTRAQEAALLLLEEQGPEELLLRDQAVTDQELAE